MTIKKRPNEEKNNDHQQKTKSSNIINLQNQADYKNMVKFYQANVHHFLQPSVQLFSTHKQKQFAICWPYKCEDESQVK